ncbi:Trp biosynthesis-associated membrane protein [Curtobacterium sp. MCPF17_050]|uniref:Trp biosynthesis-associated membrane protein n=1 Tax=Curtobacterium sp. MCPF17_050 TaxID=2175664 RepID=UPI000D8E7C47|nr:Trp biosynthesis-associated membrane protein [Curtobacterium sp. MCPF17_050]WIB14247.1 Trp biosynthesis-associated membrane protein [Curtobacterium sp. MCPF17_050]
MKRSRPLVVVVGLAVAGLVMLAWTQTWFTVHLDHSAAVVKTVAADGATVVPQYTAVAIASLALFLALTIAGRVVRVVLAVVQFLLGVAVVVTGISALSDPVAAARSAVGSVAGVSDIGAVRQVVTRVDVSIWPVVGITGGVLAALLGVAVLVLQRSWPGPSRKYGDAATPGSASAADVSGSHASDGTGTSDGAGTSDGTGASRTGSRAPVVRDAVVDWDDLSAGLDPTAGDTADGRVRTTDAVGSSERRPTGGASDNEEHREQH